MSYIQCDDVNNYKPSENLKNLFEELVIQPFNNHPPTQAWVTEVKNKNNVYHRKTILKRGRADFDMPFNGLSPEDKVLLYCVYYMPMHLYSSYHIFSSKLSLPVSNKVIFIDLGCGPLTSGIAYWAATRPSNITYIGIDRSQAMLNKALEINNNFNNENRDLLFYDFHLISDYNQLPCYLSSHVEIGNPDDTIIIFNFCYILASHTFDQNETLDSLIGVINRIANEYEKYKICGVYQNPVGRQFQENWKNLKSMVKKYNSMFDVSGFSEQFSPKVELFGKSYVTLLGEQRPLKVSYDSFNNFSKLEDYSDK